MENYLEGSTESSEDLYQDSKVKIFLEDAGFFFKGEEIVTKLDLKFQKNVYTEILKCFEDSMYNFNLTFGSNFNDKREFLDFLSSSLDYKVAGLKESNCYYMTLYFTFKGIPFYEKSIVQ